MSDASSKTQDLVKSWQSAQERVSSLKSQLNSAECVMMNAATALAKHLWPEGAPEFETFGIWVRDPLRDEDRLLTVKRKAGECSVDWYKGSGKGVGQ